MPLQKIKFGSDASSSLLNDNFDYLQKELVRTSEYVVNMNKELDAKIDLINGTVESQLKTFQEQLNKTVGDIPNVANVNFTAGEPQTSPFTVPEKGMILWDSTYPARTGAYGIHSIGIAKLLINDIEVLRHTYNFSTHTKYASGFRIPLYVKKGDVITFTNKSKLTFYPIKGE